MGYFDQTAGLDSKHQAAIKSILAALDVVRLSIEDVSSQSAALRYAQEN